jgi:GTP-binding protein HflX
MSAQTGAGVELVTQALSELLRGELTRERLLIGPADGVLRAWLFEHATVLNDVCTEEGGWRMEVELARQQVKRYLASDVRWQRSLLDPEDAPPRADGGGRHSADAPAPHHAALANHST